MEVSQLPPRPPSPRILDILLENIFQHHQNVSPEPFARHGHFSIYIASLIVPPHLREGSNVLSKEALLKLAQRV